MSTIADRLRQFVDDEMTFPGNPDAVCGELLAALSEQMERVREIAGAEPGGCEQFSDDGRVFIDPRKARDLFLGKKP